MKLSVGTSGFSYKQWKGVFYPEDLPAKAMLGYYAERLPAVEINNTFYRMPKRSVLESWAGQVGPDFQFAIKASRRITHHKRLKEADEETGYLLGNTSALGDRLGVVLFQLPPNLPVDRERLARFLELLPEGTRAAFEFRHPSWSDETIFSCLRERNCAWVHTDADGDEAAEPVSTASFGYLRLRREAYERADLAAWSGRVEARGWDQVFVFFKHEDQGPALAAEFGQLAERAAARVRPAAVGERAPAPRKTG